MLFTATVSVLIDADTPEIAMKELKKLRGSPMFEAYQITSPTMYELPHRITFSKAVETFDTFSDTVWSLWKHENR